MKKHTHSNTPRPGIVGFKSKSVQGDERAGCAISKMNECYSTEEKERKSPPKTYSEKLKDPRWQRKRLEIMERDKFTCRHCRSAEKTLNVHHRTYRKGAAPWDYEDGNFITLCESCHAEAEHQKLIVLSAMGKSPQQDQSMASLAMSIESQGDKIDFTIWGWVANELARAINGHEWLKDGGCQSACPDEMLDEIKNAVFDITRYSMEAYKHLENEFGS